MDIVVTFAIALVLFSVVITPIATVWLTMTLKEINLKRPSVHRDYIKPKERLA